MASEIIKKARILADSVRGECVKRWCKAVDPAPRGGIYVGEARRQRVVVSLTSYGRRVDAVLPATVASLLKQTFRPDAVVLWLDRDNWNDATLPMSIRRLRDAGLTVGYCDDLKSYKKFVPSIEAFPNDLIVTVDDDFYYASDFVARLIAAHDASPYTIHTHRAHRPTFDASGELRPYNDWTPLIYDTDTSPVFATTGGGCIFTPTMLHVDVTRRELFTSLCPMADDVWFYFMSILRGTKTHVLPKKRFSMTPLDNFYQLTHSSSNLNQVNRGEAFNDVQIRRVMSHYGLTSSDLTLR